MTQEEEEEWGRISGENAESGNADNWTSRK
jgi:hypothetical protein